MADMPRRTIATASDIDFILSQITLVQRIVNDIESVGTTLTSATESSLRNTLDWIAWTEGELNRVKGDYQSGDLIKIQDACRYLSALKSLIERVLIQLAQPLTNGYH
ncbi:hypothetical protein GGR54DRAFT_644731 [Hypoxylon sp. NC1633]|nr:hypothetical protein GGR54DRAFT_644731 [Hypoxylon sp. NC1633]